jgi:hypothetical protein
MFFQRPGLALNLNHYEDDNHQNGTFPNLCNDLGDSQLNEEPPNSWHSNTFTHCERPMLWFINLITDKPALAHQSQ